MQIKDTIKTFLNKLRFLRVLNAGGWRGVGSMCYEIMYRQTAWDMIISNMPIFIISGM